MTPFNAERLTIVTFLHAACAMGFLRTMYDASVTFNHGQEWVEVWPQTLSPRYTIKHRAACRRSSFRTPSST